MTMLPFFSMSSINGSVVEEGASNGTTNFQICGGWSDGPENRCHMDLTGKSKYLDSDCYSYDDRGQVPKYPCTWHGNCGRHLHSGRCSAIDQANTSNKWMCGTCYQQTRLADDVGIKIDKQKQKQTKALQNKELGPGVTSKKHNDDFATAFGFGGINAKVSAVDNDTTSTAVTVTTTSNDKPSSVRLYNLPQISTLLI